MQTLTTDVAIIGAGSAGLNARREVEKLGGSWLLIESGEYGTTCARVGCMPSKLLIAAAEAAHHVETASTFGIRVQEYSVDSRAVFERVRSERNRFAGFVVEDTEALPAGNRIHGQARFIDPTTLEIGNHTRVSAGRIIIASGSSPFIPPPYDGIREHILVNDDVFMLETLPQSLAVIGTGIIGLELGMALSRLGVQVAFFSHTGGIGPFTDPAVRDCVAGVMGNALDLRLQTRVTGAQVTDNGIDLEWTAPGTEPRTQTFEKVLVAAGRRPNLDALNLEAAGVTLDGNRLPDWDPQTTRVGNLPIFVAGDASGHRALLHEASDEGRIAGRNSMLYPDIEVHQRRTPLAIAFTDPQMAMFGVSHAELDPECTAIGQIDYSGQGRARVMAVNSGLVRLYAETCNGRLIGGEMFGPRVEHTAHLLAWVTQQQLTIREILEMPFYHPVIEEGIRTALRDLSEKLSIRDDCRCEDLAEAPGT